MREIGFYLHPMNSPRRCTAGLEGAREEQICGKQLPSMSLNKVASSLSCDRVKYGPGEAILVLVRQTNVSSL